MLPKSIPVVVGGREAPPRQPLSNESTAELLLNLTRTDRALHRIAAKSLKASGLSLLHWLALRVVLKADEQGLPASQLASSLAITSPQASHIIKSLTKGGLIRQKPLRRDYRTKQLFITSKGRTVADDARTDIQRALSEWLAVVPENYLVIYRRTLAILAAEHAKRP